MIMVGNDMGLYIAVMVLTLAIGGGAQWYVTTMLHKYQKIPCSFNITGAQMARKMSIDKGISNVGVLSGGPSQDFFDPRSNSVTLDPDAYHTTSIRMCCSISRGRWTMCSRSYTKWATQPSMPRDTA